MRHRVMGVLSASVLALALVGCSDDPEPDVADPTSEAPTSALPSEFVTDSPTSTSTPGTAAETAQQFIRRWHEVSDEMQRSGETEEYVRLGPDCGPCLETADLVEGYYDAGGFIRFDGTRIRSIERVGRLQDKLEFDVALDSAPTEYKESATGPVKTFPGGQNRIRMRVTEAGGEWRVVDYSVLAS